MCKCFIRGLNPEIEQRVARNLDVKGTVADALRIERELRAISDLRRGSSTTSKPIDITVPRETCQICYKSGHSANNCKKFNQNSYQNYSRTENLGNEILICQICKKRGHDANTCRLRDSQTRRTVNIIRENTITCQLCSKSGHNAKTCRTNNNSNQNKTFLICQWCDKPGHSASNCWKKQNDQQTAENKSKISCQNCNNFGHTLKIVDLS
ncbi:hypothetical protein P5V15_015015 [Pogonomyrmex californicus]